MRFTTEALRARRGTETRSGLRPPLRSLRLCGERPRAIIPPHAENRALHAIGEGALQARAKEFVAQADKVFPGTAEAYTGKAVRQIWPKYEWTLGSYTCYRPGQYQKYMNALVQPQGRLIFAGEHTLEENGFMNSAVESGERAATQVLAALGRGQLRAA